MPEIIKKNYKIIRYVFSGGTAVFSSLSSLYVLVDFFHLWYLVGAIIAFCFGAVVSYCLQKFFTFQDYSTENMHIQFSKFFFYSLFMLGANTLFMYLCVDIFGFWYFFSQIVITICTAFINYLIFNRFLFK